MRMLASYERGLARKMQAASKRFFSRFMRHSSYNYSTKHHMLKNAINETTDTMSYTKVVVTKENGYKSHVAACDIKAGVDLCEVYGAVMNAPTRYSIQVGMNEHVDVESPICYTNHSCSPNCSFDFRKYPWTLTTIRDVSEGEEISFNYLTTEYKMADGFVCTCGSEKCYGTIKGFFYIKTDQKDKLLKISSPTMKAQA